MSQEAEAAVEQRVKRMRLRYAGTCVRCAASLEAKAWALYDRSTKTVSCDGCPSVAEREVDSVIPGELEEHALPWGAEPTLQIPLASEGVAGASALREFERRSSAREERVRSAHPKIGGLLLSLFDDPQSTKAWASGAVGEQRLGAMFDKVTGPRFRVLHDRRIPGSRANIDHLMICPAGVFVVDAKRYPGRRPELRVEGGILRPRVETLTVGGWDRSSLVDGVLKQVGVVQAALRAHVEAPIRGVMCFVDADWPLIGGSFTTRDVAVVWPKKLAAMLAEPGPLDEPRIAEVHVRLAQAFPAA